MILNLAFYCATRNSIMVAAGGDAEFPFVAALIVPSAGLQLQNQAAER
jgi:hypothetical protein